MQRTASTSASTVGVVAAKVVPHFPVFRRPLSIIEVPRPVRCVLHVESVVPQIQRQEKQLPVLTHIEFDPHRDDMAEGARTPVVERHPSQNAGGVNGWLQQPR